MLLSSNHCWYKITGGYYWGSDDSDDKIIASLFPTYYHTITKLLPSSKSAT